MALSPYRSMAVAIPSFLITSAVPPLSSEVTVSTLSTVFHTGSSDVTTYILASVLAALLLGLMCPVKKVCLLALLTHLLSAGNVCKCYKPSVGTLLHLYLPFT